MTTYEIIYKNTTYYVTLDETGALYDLLYEPFSGGPLLNADPNALPQWLLNKVQSWWQANNERIEDEM